MYKCFFSFLLLLLGGLSSLQGEVRIDGSFIHLRPFQQSKNGILYLEPAADAKEGAAPYITQRALTQDAGFGSGIKAAFELCGLPEEGYPPSSLQLQYISWIQGKGSRRLVEGSYSPFSGEKKALFKGGTLSYDTKLALGDVNYWHHTTPRGADYFSVSWLLGARVGKIMEGFAEELTGGAQTFDYKVKTSNTLYGVQLGGDIQVNPSPLFSWGIDLRFGGGVNKAHRDTDLKSGSSPETASLSKGIPTLLGEFSPSLSFALLSNIRAKLEYDLFFLSGLALAPRQQLALSGDQYQIKDLDRKGSMIYHGAALGLGIEF